MKRLFIAILVVFGMSSCDELHQIIQEYPTSTAGMAPTQTEIIAGLKEALRVGITNTVMETNQKDGFYGNNLIHIPVPPEVEKIKTTLKNLGYTKPVDEFELSLNRAAEQASGKAVDIFTTAITKMTITDAVDIWKGEDDAATQYLKRTTNAQLEQAFSPITKQAIESTHVTQYWDDIANIYNAIPFVEKVNPNLEQYVNEKTIDGLFLLVAKEEKKIRDDPQARVSDILKRVFGYQE